MGLPTLSFVSPAFLRCKVKKGGNGREKGVVCCVSKKINVVEAVRAMAQPVAERMGLVLWDVLFVKEGPSWFLRLIIDKDGGVDIEDCERFSREIDPMIDELDPTELEYYLEVSSPGLGRPLKTDAHLEAYLGKPVAVRLYKPDAQGVKEACGLLASYDAQNLTIDTQEGTMKFERAAVGSLKADDDKDLFGGKGQK